MTTEPHLRELIDLVESAGQDDGLQEGWADWMSMSRDDAAMRRLGRKAPGVNDIVALDGNPKQRIGYVVGVEHGRDGGTDCVVNIDQEMRHYFNAVQKSFKSTDLVKVGRLKKGKLKKLLRRAMGRIPGRAKMLKQLQAGIVDVTFKKVNGKMRKLRMTLQPGRFPKYMRKTLRRKKPNPKVLAGWEVDLGEWRSFRVASVTAWEPWNMTPQVAESAALDEWQFDKYDYYDPNQGDGCDDD